MKRILKLFGFGSLITLISYYFLPEQQLTPGQKADEIIVYKADHVLKLFYKGKIIASYSVSISKKAWMQKKNVVTTLPQKDSSELQNVTTAPFTKE
jgi:hypothetical protein